MMPYRLIPLISALEEFHFFVTVGPSALFGSALNPPKTENFRSYMIDLISRVPKVSKTYIGEVSVKFWFIQFSILVKFNRYLNNI